nr:polyferredoxin [Salmonella sp. NCTC 7297]
MVNLTIDPAIDVTQACVRRRFRFSSCRACADVCPAQAFSLAQGPGQHRYDALHSMWRLSVCLPC